MSNRVLDTWLTMMAIAGSVMVAFCVIGFVSCGIAAALDLITLVPYHNLVLIHYLRPDAVEVEVLKEDGTRIGTGHLYDPCVPTQPDNCSGGYYAFELQQPLGKAETFLVRIKPESAEDPNDVEEHRVTIRAGGRGGNMAVIRIGEEDITTGLYDWSPAP